MPTSPHGDAVSTTGLTKRFGDRTVVDHLDLSIPLAKGEPPPPASPMP